jgi:hypothetical protein
MPESSLCGINWGNWVFSACLISSTRSRITFYDLAAVHRSDWAIAHLEKQNLNTDKLSDNEYFFSK